MSLAANGEEDPVSERKKVYIAEREIPALFEALMTGLMNYEPDNHYDFLIDSLKKARNSAEPIRWDTFIKMHESRQ